MSLADKTGVLRNFLGTLPEQAASKLALAVELDRLMDGKSLPHDAILAGLRPVLRNVHPSLRTKTPQRLFCQPFEDLLSSEPRKEKRKAILLRTNATPVWNWVSETLLPDQAAAYVRDAKALILAGQDEAALQRAESFWIVAAQGMRETLADAGTVKALRKHLDQNAIEDAREMALLLAEGAEIRKIQERLPKPFPHLNDEILRHLRESYDALIERSPDIAPYVAVVAMNRLARPCEALRLPLMISRQSGDTLIARTDMGLVGEILFGRMDALQAAILATRTLAFDAETLLAQVAGFSELSSSVVKEIEVRRNGEWGQRLLKDRAAVGNVMDAFMERAVKEVTAALPMFKGASDFSRATPPDKRASGYNYARLVGGARLFAAAASFAAKQQAAWEELSRHLRRYVEDGMRELAGAGTEKRRVVEAQLGYCVELAGALFSAEEAELIHRRIRAAQAAAA